MIMNNDPDDTVYYTIDKKTGAGRMFFRAQGLAAHLLGKQAKDHLIIKEDLSGPRFVSLKRQNVYDLEQILLMS